MSVKLKIKVTKEILQRSAFCSGSGITEDCAIALAVRDLFPKASVSWRVIHTQGISKEGFFWLDPYPSKKILLPESARDFIEKFDLGTPSERMLIPELEFEVDVPDTVLEDINIEELKPLLENHPTLQIQASSL
jgi:hypothetical protein